MINLAAGLREGVEVVVFAVDFERLWVDEGVFKDHAAELGGKPCEGREIHLGAISGKNRTRTEHGKE